MTESSENKNILFIYHFGSDVTNSLTEKVKERQKATSNINDKQKSTQM